MADFCAQCSVELFGVDGGNFAGVGKDIMLEEGEGILYWVCEGCGSSIFDHAGQCIDKVACHKEHYKTVEKQYLGLYSDHEASLKEHFTKQAVIIIDAILDEITKDQQ
jgi:hypothetical protein